MTSPPRRWPAATEDRPADSTDRIQIRYETLADLQDAFLRAQADVWVEDCIADREAGTLTFAVPRGGVPPRLGGGRFQPDPKRRR